MKILLFNCGENLLDIKQSLIGAGHTIKVFHSPIGHIWSDETLNQIETSNYDYLFPSHTDKDVMFIATLNEKLGLPGIKTKTAKQIFTKLNYYRDWERLGILHPKILQVFENSVSKLKPEKNLLYPCVIKPESGTASSGVKIVENKKDLVKHLCECIINKKKYNKQKFLVQEFISGNTASVVGRITNGIPQIDMLYDLECYGEYPVESGYSYPSKYAGKIESDLLPQLHTYFQHIGLDNSPFMLDVLIQDDKVYWIDFGARLSFNAQTLISYGGEHNYGIKLINNLLFGHTLQMELKKPSVIFRQLNVPVGSYSNITCDVEDLADKMHITKDIKLPKIDGDVYNTCYAIVSGNSITDAENKFKTISESLKIIP